MKRNVTETRKRKQSTLSLCSYFHDEYQSFDYTCRRIKRRYLVIILITLLALIATVIISLSFLLPETKESK